MWLPVPEGDEGLCLIEFGQSGPVELSFTVTKVALKWKRVGDKCLVETLAYLIARRQVGGIRENELCACVRALIHPMPIVIPSHDNQNIACVFCGFRQGLMLSVVTWFEDVIRLFISVLTVLLHFVSFPLSPSARTVLECRWAPSPSGYECKSSDEDWRPGKLLQGFKTTAPPVEDPRSALLERWLEFNTELRDKSLLFDCQTRTGTPSFRPLQHITWHSLKEWRIKAVWLLSGSFLLLGMTAEVKWFVLGQGYLITTETIWSYQRPVKVATQETNI